MVLPGVQLEDHVSVRRYAEESLIVHPQEIAIDIHRPSGGAKGDDQLTALGVDRRQLFALATDDG